MRISLRIILIRLLLSLASILLCTPAAATDGHAFAYICSDNHVYSVRVASNPGGYSPRGPWYEWQAFCHRSAKTLDACKQERSRATQRCFSEFKLRGNSGMIAGRHVIWANRIKHSPTLPWFQALQLTRPLRETCSSAIRALNCKRNRTGPLQSSHLKCIYERSGFNNRDAGRHCFTQLTYKLSSLARVQRGVAGR